jgi:hypothetical protein
MKRTVGIIALGLGVFLLVLAPLFRFYVLPHVEVAPLNEYDTTVATATGATVFDPAQLKEVTSDLVANQIVQGDIPGSQAAPVANTAVWNEFQRVNRADGTLVDATTDRVAFDRTTSQIVDCCGNSVNGVEMSKSGLQPYKFGFNAEQTTYQYYDVTLKTATPMEFVKQTSVNGVSVYEYQQTIEPTQIGTLGVPGSLVGSPADSYQAPRYYANVRTVWVEPTTGIIVDGSEDQLQTLRGPDGTDRLTLIKASLSFDDATVSHYAKLATDGKNQLTLIGTTVPIIAALLGIVLIVVGVLLARSRSGSDADGALPDAPAAAEVTA